MISDFADWLVSDLLSLSGNAGEAAHFFVYDTIKILLLLFVMIALLGTLRTYVPPQKVKQALSGKRAGVGNLFAALFGALTPFCSCSGIPIFLSFLEVGVPLGVALSFLITSPLINEYLVVLMLGFFGLKITLYYILAGLTIGVVGGMLLGRMGLEKHLVKDLISKKAFFKTKTYSSFRTRARFGLQEARDIIDKLWKWILIGVGIGAILHGFVPAETIQGIVSKGGILAVPIATLAGVPLYTNCAAVVPVAMVLFEKGVPLGTALAFMMASAALSLPEAVILRRAMKLELIAIFFGIVALGIMLIGFAFNFLV